MKYRLLFIIGFLLLNGASFSIAQKLENVWIFGRRVGLDFNTTTPSIISSYMSSNEACASVCDQQGALLFYTDGTSVFNRQHQFMGNGTNIAPFDTRSTTQGALIIPMPDSASLYFVFSLSPVESEANRGRLYYSVVDMDLNGGLGGVEEGRKAILIDSNLTEQMTGVSGRSCNVWLLVVTEQDTLKAYSIDGGGIQLKPVLSSLIPRGNRPGTGKNIGNICVSPDRSRLVMARGNGLSLYDFNALTGQVSQARDLSIQGSEYYYACFSPDNTKLYTSKQTYTSGSGFEQYDLNSATPLPVNILPANGYVGGALKLAPDGKIYCANGFGRYLSIIRQPNKAGTACQLDYLAMTFDNSGNPVLGLPNVVPVIIPENDTVVRTLVKNDAPCFQSSYLLSSDQSGADLVWDDGSKLPQRKVTAPGSYWVRYRNHCSVFMLHFDVSFPKGILPRLEVRNSCKGGETGKVAVFRYPGDTLDYQYTWRGQDQVIKGRGDHLEYLAAGSYTLQIATAECDTLLHFVIQDEKEEHKVSFRTDTLACVGETLVFTNTSDAHFDNSYYWSFGDQHSFEGKDPTHIYGKAGQYECVLIGVGEICSDTFRATITVDAPERDPYFEKSGESICMGQTITFYPRMEPHIRKLLWDFGDDNSFESEPGDTTIHSYAQSGTMPVVLTARFRACPDKHFSDFITVYSLPLLYLGPDTILCPGQPPLLLSNKTADANSYHYLWSTGDTSVTIQALHPGLYSLTATTTEGCTANENIRISKGCYLDVPNAFTPDGDGNNDYFFPRALLTKGIRNFYMQVRDRWGQLVFETHNTTGRGWDGRFNGKEQNAGGYVYQIVIETTEGKREQYDGNVTLLH